MKKITVLFLAIIISLCAVSSAFAAKWVKVVSSKDITVYVETSSLQYKGNIIRAWEKWIPHSKNAIKTFSYACQNPVLYILYRVEYNVDDRTCRNLSTIPYDKDSNLIGEFPTPYKIRSIVPCTVDDVLLDFCIKNVGIKSKIKNWFKQR